MPTTSFPVVIKGPVAIAGSIPNFSRIIGTEVPIKAATTITNIMETEISPIQLVLALPSLVCLIIAWVAMFQQGKTWLGIACIILTFLCGIGGLITFIWGWMSNNVNIKVMIAWTLLIIVSTVVSVTGM